MNVLIRDVVRLLSSDTIIRNIPIALELDPGLPVVSGDRIQLQQVVLNLLVNAMDAVADLGVPHGRSPCGHAASRTGSRCRGGHGERARRDGTDEVFEPFYTTKPAGMGMGLTISRSIVEAHGGRIWATNSPLQGARFHVALPAGRVPVR